MSLSSAANTFRQTIWKIANRFGPFAPFVSMLLLGLVILSLSRVGLVLWKFNRVHATGELLAVMYQGYVSISSNLV